MRHLVLLCFLLNLQKTLNVGELNLGYAKLARLIHKSSFQWFLVLVCETMGKEFKSTGIDLRNNLNWNHFLLIDTSQEVSCCMEYVELLNKDEHINCKTDSSNFK